MSSLAAHKGDYGYDAPYVLLGFWLAAVISLGLLVAGLVGRVPSLTRIGAIDGVIFLIVAGSFTYTTRRGKFIAWARVLGKIQWRGDERVLDLGCGRGALLTMVARCLATGTVTGVDIWRGVDQAGSSEEGCRKNAVSEGVSDRVILQTADMRALPFAAATFDVVVSSLAIHNIPSASARMLALGHAVRVLRPGGWLAIADIKYTRAYARELSRLGLTDVARRPLGWRFWYGSPFAATSLVTARKGPPEEGPQKGDTHTSGRGTLTVPRVPEV